MKRTLYLAVVLLFGIAAWAGDQSHSSDGGGHGDSQLIFFLLAMAVILVAAKMGGELFERWSMPAVLGELVIGVVLGNLVLVGIPFFESLKNQPGLEMVAEIGVILLLFDVGLESQLHELLEVGLSAMLVALLGVLAPMGLGYWVSSMFLTEAAWYVHLFIGATLAATSVGITARVLQDLNKTKSKEARIILGAAVVDDVLGLIVLAVVSGIVSSIAQSGQMDVEYLPVLKIIGKALAFMVGTFLIGRFVVSYILRFAARFRVRRIPLVIAMAHCFAMSALASAIGLAPIVGAFAAGLYLEEGHFEVYRGRGEQDVRALMDPILTVIVPVFFIMMGLEVDLTSFASAKILGFAAALSLAAIVGKQVCSLGVLEKGINRLVVGVGMIPRGEVGLIFTRIGAGLMVNNQPIFSSTTVSALVVMVMVTTLLTPPVLKILFKR